MPFLAEMKQNGAGEGNRTLVCSLEDCRSTIELRPQRVHKSYRPPMACQLRRFPDPSNPKSLRFGLG